MDSTLNITVIMPYSTWVSLSPISFLYRKRTGWSTSTSFISRGTDGNLCLNEFYSCMTLRVNIESFLNILAFLIDFMLLFPSRLVYSTVKVSHFFIFSFQAAKLVNFKVVLKWSSPDFLKVFYSFFFLLFCFGVFHSCSPQFYYLVILEVCLFAC